MRLAPLFAAFALGGVGAVGALSAPRIERALFERPSVVVGDRRLLPGETPRAFVESLASQVARREAFFSAPDAVERARFADLGLALDVDATLLAVLHALPAPSLAERIAGLVGTTPEPPVVPMKFELDRERARAYLERLGKALERAPVDARLDLARHQRVRAASGRDLDVGATLDAIDRGERRDLAHFELSFTRVEPSVHLSDLAAVDVRQVLSSYETDFSHKARSRVPNIRTAARYLDGTIIAPGQVFSFNHTVGPRTEARGFRNAPVIVEDELEPGLGGGVCQVATTVFAAAMLGGLDIVERRSHSRPSGYAPLGLDATVIYPEVDLRLRNPYDSPLMIHAFLPNAGTLRVELLGRRPPGKIQHYFSTPGPVPFTRRVVVHPELPAGTIDKRQKGHPGYDGVSTLVTTAGDGSRHSRTYPSKYYPVPEVFWVAEGVAPASLPPLPEGAIGMEVRTLGEALDGERGDSAEP